MRKTIPADNMIHIKVRNNPGLSTLMKSAHSRTNAAICSNVPAVTFVVFKISATASRNTAKMMIRWN